MVDYHQLSVATALGLGCAVTAIVVGIYFGVGLAHPWLYKVVHVAAGLSLAMFFTSIGLAYIGVCVGVFGVSTSWEFFEYLLTLPGVQSAFHALFPWYGVPQVSVEDLLLDYVRNFFGVALFYLFRSLGSTVR
jgi:hypothetical protein